MRLCMYISIAQDVIIILYTKLEHSTGVEEFHVKDLRNLPTNWWNIYPEEEPER